MITFLSALLGFVSSLAPKLLEFFQDKRDKAHELALLRAQLEFQSSENKTKLEAIGTMADMVETQVLCDSSKLSPSGVKWVDALLALLAGSVRPVITYAFFGFYAAIKIIIIYNATSLSAGILAAWAEEDMGLFAAVMCYWFGARTVQKFWRK